MWGLGLIMLCLLTFVIIGVISNISLTNQQDYYGVKQTTEAGAYDSVELVQYKRGVCVCTAATSGSSENGQIKFTSKTQYTIEEPDLETGECSNKSTCNLMLGEYVIDPNVFVESVISRLGSIIKPTEIYDITVQEVIPYPPKVSVNIEFKQALNIDGQDTIHQIIPNKFDGIFEDTGPHSVLEYADNQIEDWTLTCGNPEKKTYCYYDKDGSVSSNKWRFCPQLTDESKCVASGYEEKIEVSDVSECVDSCFCKNGQSCVMSAKVIWGGEWTATSSDKCGEVCYKKYTNKANDEYELKWASSSPGSDWEKTNIEKTNCRMACYVKESNGNKEYSWNGYGSWTGWKEDTSIKKKEDCKATTQPVHQYSSSSCNKHYHIYKIFCTDSSGGEHEEKCHVDGPSVSKPVCPSGKPSTCNCSTGTFNGKYCNTQQWFRVWEKGTNNMLCDLEAANANAAISSCSACKSKSCVAICYNK